MALVGWRVEKVFERGRGLVDRAQHRLQQGLGGDEVRIIGVRLLELLDVLERGRPLAPFEHLLDPLHVVGQVGAAELHFLPLPQGQ